MPILSSSQRQFQLFIKRLTPAPDRHEMLSMATVSLTLPPNVGRRFFLQWTGFCLVDRYHFHISANQQHETTAALHHWRSARMVTELAHVTKHLCYIAEIFKCSVGPEINPDQPTSLSTYDRAGKVNAARTFSRFPDSSPQPPERDLRTCGCDKIQLSIHHFQSGTGRAGKYP